MIHIYRGYHSYSLLGLLKSCLQKRELLVLVPPHIKSLDFLSHLPEGEAALHGEFNDKTVRWIPAQAWEGKASPSLALFTSGTVRGEPRLVFYSEQNFLSSLESIRRLFSFDLRSVFCFPQPTHTFGAILGYVHAAVHDLELLISEGKYSRQAQELWFQKSKSQMLTLGTPVHFYDLVEQANDHSFSPSTTSICGGAPVSPELWRKMRDVLKIEKPSIGYGATEAAPGLTHLAPGVEPQVYGEIGQPLKNVEIQFSENGLEFKGPNLCYAYVENGEIYFPTRLLLKDRIEWRNSSLVYGGRLELTLNRGGVKIPLEDIEARLKSEKDMNTIAVAAPDERLGEDLGLVFEGVPTQRAELRTWIRNNFGFEISDEQMIAVKVLTRTVNGKVDREHAKLMITGARNLKYPVPIEKLFIYLPHRPPAVWLDEVVSVDSAEGVCGVTLDPSKNYYTGNTFRVSAYVEWMAQSYAYIRACQGLSGLVSQPGSPKQAYLVALKNVEVLPQPKVYTKGDQLLVRVRKTHHVGPVSLIQGQVEDKSGAVLCRGQLKIFAN